MAIRIETRQPSALIVVLSLIIVIVAIIAHITPIRSVPWLTTYHFWIAIAGYALLLWRTLF
jgi:hypothetical protein